MLIIGSLAFAGGPEYEKAMGQALQDFTKCQTAPEFRNVANQFDRIGNVAKDEWLPLYYRAYCFVVMSFVDQTDGDTKDAYLDEAEKSIDRMLEMASEESEVHALQAFYYNGRLMVNPQVRGMKYGMLSGQAVGKSLKLDPSNPRAQYGQIQNEMGKAQFFGQDVDGFCAQAKIAHDSFDAYPLATEFHPKWGKRELKKLSTACKTEEHE